MALLVGRLSFPRSSTASIGERMLAHYASLGEVVKSGGLDPDGCAIRMESGSGFGVSPSTQPEWAKSLFYRVGESRSDLLEWGVGLLDEFMPDIRGGQLEDFWGGLTHVAIVPVLGSGYAAVTTPADVDGFYQDGMAWPDGIEVRPVGEHLRITRLLDVVDREAYEEAALIQNLALWFQALPGCVHPPRSVVPPAPPRPPRVLEAVGCDPSTGEVEYAADLHRGDRITWWELVALQQQVETRRLSDGQKISGVRVVFSREDAAIENLVPLLDCGVSVYTYDESGALVRITWE